MCCVHLKRATETTSGEEMMDLSHMRAFHVKKTLLDMEEKGLSDNSVYKHLVQIHELLLARDQMRVFRGTAVELPEEMNERTRAQLVALRAVSRGLKVPVEILGACQSTQMTFTVPRKSSLPSSFLEADRTTIRSDFPELNLRRESLVHSRMNARLQELRNIMPYLSSEAKNTAVVEWRALRLVSFQRKIRSEMRSHCRPRQGFPVSRSSIESRVHDFSTGIKRLEKEQRQAEEMERQQKQRDQESFVNLAFQKLKEIRKQSQAASDLRMLVSREVSVFHARRKRDREKQREIEERRRLKMLRTDDEEAFREWVESTKQTHLKKLLDWTEGLFAEVQKKLGVQIGDGESKGSVSYYRSLHAQQEVVQEQPSILEGGELKDYQVAGLQWLVSLYNNNINGILADEMGLGKTIQTIALFAYLMQNKGDFGPFLVIVPLSTVENWVQEFHTWLGPHQINVVKYVGDQLHRRGLQRTVMDETFNVLLTTYDYVTRKRDATLLKKVAWKYIVVDEGHRMKNHKCKLVQVSVVSFLPLSSYSSCSLPSISPTTFLCACVPMHKFTCVCVLLMMMM